MAPPPPTFTTPAPVCKTSLLAFPTPQILLVTLNRPEVMNCIDTAGHYELEQVWTWYDGEPSLRCAIITGEAPPAAHKSSGSKSFKRAFCAGQDLKDLNSLINSEPKETKKFHPPGGFAGLSRRVGKKPVIAAIDGICFGGGFEIIANTDINLCTPISTFAFPELHVGVSVFAGALPRLLTTIGYQRLNELIYTSRVLSASEAKSWGVINTIVPEGADVVAEAIKLANLICDKCSPDSVVVARRAVQLGWGWQGPGAWGVEEATRLSEDGCGAAKGVGKTDLEKAENIKEGLKAFVERRRPVWKDSKL